MRTLLTCLLLAAAVLPAQAQTVTVCDRTPQVRDAIVRALEADDCAAVDSRKLPWLSVPSLDLTYKRLTVLQARDFEGLPYLSRLYLGHNQLTTLPAGVFDGLTRLQALTLNDNRLTALPAGVFADLTSLIWLHLNDNRLTALPAGVFDGLTDLRDLWLHDNQLTTLPAGEFSVFYDLASLLRLDLSGNRLTGLPAGVFDGSMRRLERLWLHDNQLTILPASVFDGLNTLFSLRLERNQLTGLPAGVFDMIRVGGGQCDGRPVEETAWNSARGKAARARLCGGLWLSGNRLTSLPDGVFDSLAGTERWWGRHLDLSGNQLTSLPDDVFDSLSLGVLYLNDNRLTTLPVSGFRVTNLLYLDLSDNRLTTLPAGVFDKPINLQELHLNDNRLTTLPDDAFRGLYSVILLDLRSNHLVGLTRYDPLFERFPASRGSRSVDILLEHQTEPPPSRLAAAVPLMISASDSTRQGFVRIVNESGESSSVRVFAFDDGGYAPNPVEIRLGAGQVIHFNSNDLEDGNREKGIERGVGSPVQGDWRLDLETALEGDDDTDYPLSVRVLSFVRTMDGFLTAMHDVLPRDADRRLVAQTFNPGRNMNQVSRLRLVNTWGDAESVSIEGVDDRGNNAGPVTLWLAPNEARTLSAFDLENGAEGLTGTLGGGAGKWRLFITAGDSVVGMSLLDSVSSGHLTNISTTGVVP